MAEQKDLSSLERSSDLSRINAFTDGVFAIAITLLVLQLEVPAFIDNASGLWQGLGDQEADFLAFTNSFAVIGMFWYLHHRFMRMVREFDKFLVALNLLYLFFIVLIPFSSQLMGEHGWKIPVTDVIYLVNVALVTFVAGLMYIHTSKQSMIYPEYGTLVRKGIPAVFARGIICLAIIPFAFLIGPYTPLLLIPLWLLNPYERARRVVDEYEEEHQHSDGKGE